MARNCSSMRARSVRGSVAGRRYTMLDMLGGYSKLVNGQLPEGSRARRPPGRQDLAGPGRLSVADDQGAGPVDQHFALTARREWPAS
jgi:hypothetical protein